MREEGKGKTYREDGGRASRAGRRKVARLVAVGGHVRKTRRESSVSKMAQAARLDELRTGLNDE
jgi:hypothetical protein